MVSIDSTSIAVGGTGSVDVRIISTGAEQLYGYSVELSSMGTLDHLYYVWNANYDYFRECLPMCKLECLACFSLMLFSRERLLLA